MDALALMIANGLAAGVSGYATVLVSGLMGRFDVASTPEVLQRTDVLVFAAVLTAVEFVADKVAVVDSVWDSVHTVVRPAIGAWLGVLIADGDGAFNDLSAAGLTGALALVSHGTKAGLRLAVNTSPEPFSNVAVSFGEDISVVSVVLLAWEHPWPAAIVALVLLAVGVTLLVVLLRRARKGWRWLGERIARVAPPLAERRRGRRMG